MTDEEKAENYIIQKYRISENYRVDNEETRAYMKNKVHSDYQQEYELYLFGFNNGFDKGYHRQRERCDEEMKDLRNQFVLDGERIKQLGIENEALKQSVEEGEEIIAELREKITDLNKPPLYDGYSLQKENAKLSKMLEMAMKDALSQSYYAECNGSVYGLNCSSIDEYRAKLEKRVEKEK